MASTRDRIVQSASSLFYSKGIRSVSVDMIAERAGLTKRSLYYHFKSKDELIDAYLSERSQPNLDMFKKWYADADGDVGAKVRAIFVNLATAAGSPRWKGCGFLRTAAELVTMPGHAALKTADRHKRQVEEWLSLAFSDAGIDNPLHLAQEIRLLLDGSFSVVLINRDPAYMEVAGEAAETLVKARKIPRAPLK